MIKLIVSDIDGTILPYGKTQVSDATMQAFHAALQEGLLCGPASGRAYSWLGGFFHGDESCYKTAIAANGLQVYLDGECIVRQLINHDALQQTADFLREIPEAGLIVFTEGAHPEQPYMCAGDREVLRKAYARYADVVEVLPSLPDEPITKGNVYIHGDYEATVSLVRRLNTEIAELDFDVPQPGFSNIMPSGWGKGAAIQALCSEAEIDRSEVIAFGDGGNDISLFEQVGYAVAVTGASEDAKKAADFVIGACEDNAVAQTIQMVLAGTFPPHP